MEISEKDLYQLKQQGITLKEFNSQLEDFKQGFPFAELVKPASTGDGIRQYNDKQSAEFVKLYTDNKDKFSVTKFVPASGAATRMMRDFYSFLSEYKDAISTPIDGFPEIKKAIDNIDKFAFYDILCKCMDKAGISLNDCIKQQDYRTIIEFIVTEKGLNYGKSPKAWIIFHKNKENNRLMTAFEQHMAESCLYACSKGNADIHFTVTEEHLQGFNKLKQQLVPVYEKLTKLKYNITFSFQQHSTDTVAVNKDNSLFRTSKGDLLFRPSGHGALIHNLNSLNSDIIFIKNIDNISSCNTELHTYNKKLLAGVLISTVQERNALISLLKQPNLTKQDLNGIVSSISSLLNITDIKDEKMFSAIDDYKTYLIGLINKPVRICGMVKNTGEPGGGPFFCKNDDGISLQITEKAQVNTKDETQKNIFMSATHFNPVDLAVHIKDCDNNKFNLLEFIDRSAGFISEKSYEGQNIKAMEKPGLWNGAMAKWITVFVEVPVKTLNDLLKKEHL